MKVSNCMTIHQARKELAEAQRQAFLLSLDGLSPSEKQARRRERRQRLLAQKERNQAERAAFRETLLVLPAVEKKAKLRGRKEDIVETCITARDVLHQAARAAFMSKFEHVSEAERDTKWLERRARIQQRPANRKAACRPGQGSIGDLTEMGAPVEQMTVKYDHAELAAFQRSIQGLGPRAKQIMWQVRIKELRNDLKTSGPGNGNRRALRLARQQRDLVARRVALEKHALTTKFGEMVVDDKPKRLAGKHVSVSGEGDTGKVSHSKDQRKKKYDVQELASFLASLEDLAPEESKGQWQARIRDIRADIRTNGPGGGNRRALRLSQQVLNKTVNAGRALRKVNFIDSVSKGMSATPGMDDTKELAAFQGSLKGLPKAFKEVQWQERIEELTKALHHARRQKNRLARRAFMASLVDLNGLTREEKVALFRAYKVKRGALIVNKKDDTGVSEDAVTDLPEVPIKIE